MGFVTALYDAALGWHSRRLSWRTATSRLPNDLYNRETVSPQPLAHTSVGGCRLLYYLTENTTGVVQTVHRS